MGVFAAERSIERTLRAIGEDTRSGANELACRALRLLRAARPVAGVSAARYRRAVRELARSLERARPAMTAVGGVVRATMSEFGARARRVPGAGEAWRVLRTAAEEVEEGFETAQSEVVRRFASRFSKCRRPLVISYSSQVLAALEGLPRRRVALTVCESRPGLEGRQTARRARGWARSVRVITEAGIALAMDSCDAVVMGCDAIGRDGSIANKTGSAVLAQVATVARVPVIVLGSTYKFCTSMPTERRPPGEIWARAPRGIDIDNVTFERVDAAHIRYLVLENGVFTPRRLAAMRARNVTRR